MCENPYNIRVFRKMHHNVYYVVFGKGKNIMRINSLEEQRFGNLKSYCEELKKISNSLKAMLGGKKSAFTLAEVLIVVAIIGVVAALVLPSFMQDMAERINSNRQANIAQKITKSVELMAVNGDYQDIKTTEQFVNKLSKYLKIAKICDNEHLTDCWPTRKIKTAKGDDYNIEDAKTSKDLHTRGSETDNVGVVLADGATLIMTFNPDATNISAEGGFIPYKKSLPIGGGKFEEFAYSSNATGAIDFVMDVNGKTGPNAESDLKGNYYDIRSFKNATFTSGACAGGIRVGAYCVVEIGTDYLPINCSVSFDNKEQICDSKNSPMDYRAGAHKSCIELGMKIPTRAELVLLKNLKINLDVEKYMNTGEGVCNSNYAVGTSFSCTATRANHQLSPVLCVSNNSL